MVATDVEAVVEKIIRIRDYNRDVLSWDDLDALADACNMLSHNAEAIASAETEREEREM